MFQWSLTLSHVQIQFLRAVAVAEWDAKDPWWYHTNIGHLFTNDLPTWRTLKRQGLIKDVNRTRLNEKTGKKEQTRCPVVTDRGKLVLLLIEHDAKELSKTDNAKKLTSAFLKRLKSKERSAA